MYAVEPSTRQPVDPGPQIPVPALGGRRRRQRLAAPYLLALPTVIVLAALLAYPVIKMIMLSFQHVTQRDLFTGESPAWIGFGNYAAVLADGFFWTVVLRTIVVAVVCVVLSVVVGLAVALLMRRVAGWVRILMTVAMMLVWSMPQLVSTQVFGWLVDSDWGVLNWALDKIPGVDYTNHSWWINPVQGWSVIIALVVWGAIPFIAISLYAGLSQVPRELIEAAVVDGAGPAAVFRGVTFPILRPLVGIVTTLSAIWDMGIFTQIYVIRGSKPELDYYNLAIYAYQEAFTKSHYSPGAAISILTVILMLGVMAFYVRQMFRIGDAD
ncbi:sugar ABC transporter permease [Rugosimonospora acidiphila]|uniref:Sugar ABC transporter permease n=1 Tax=Rugosimonospora acidiphila TaxID=556531 RepID=A0ABP9S3C7_9ACTN